MVIMEWLFIIIGIIIAKYIFPIFDVLLECFTYRMTVSATKNDIKAKKIVAEYEKEYGNETVERMPAIGFELPKPEEQYYDDDEDDF